MLPRGGGNARGRQSHVHHVPHRNAAVHRVHGHHPGRVRSAAGAAQPARKVSHVSRRLFALRLPVPVARPAGHVAHSWMALHVRP